MVVAAVVVSLHVELLELHLDDLEGTRKTGKRITLAARRGSGGLTNSFITFPSWLFINATPQIWFQTSGCFADIIFPRGEDELERFSFSLCCTFLTQTFSCSQSHYCNPHIPYPGFASTVILIWWLLMSALL